MSWARLSASSASSFGVSGLLTTSVHRTPLASVTLTTISTCSISASCPYHSSRWSRRPNTTSLTFPLSTGSRSATERPLPPCPPLARLPQGPARLVAQRRQSPRGARARWPGLTAPQAAGAPSAFDGPHLDRVAAVPAAPRAPLASVQGAPFLEDGKAPIVGGAGDAAIHQMTHIRNVLGTSCRGGSRKFATSHAMG